MAQARAVRRTIRNINKIKTWQLVVLLVLMAFVAATFLRLNNIGMVQRRDAVISADEKGDDQVTKNRVLELQRYVSGHMNTDKNDVYLASKYERDRQAAVQKAAESNQSGDVINAQVDAICKPQFSGYNQGYVDCFAREYAKFAPGTDPVSQVKSPDPDKYRFVFASPTWSPDFAGFSVLASVVILLVIVARWITLIVLYLMLKVRYRDA